MLAFGIKMRMRLNFQECLKPEKAKSCSSHKVRSLTKDPTPTNMVYKTGPYASLRKGIYSTRNQQVLQKCVDKIRNVWPC